MDILELPLQKLNLLRYSLDELAGSIFTQVKGDVPLLKPLEAIIGFLSGAALSIVLGVIFFYLVQLSGFRFVKSKGVLYGFIIWFLIYGGIYSALHVSPLRDYDLTHTAIQLLSHLLFGLILGIVISKKGGPLFNNE